MNSPSAETDDSATKVSLSNLEAFIKKTLGGSGEGLKIETLVNTILNKFYGSELFSDYASDEQPESKWKVGTQVLVFSKSKDRWIRGFVERVEDEGYVTVAYANSVKTVHPDSDDIKLPGDKSHEKKDRTSGGDKPEEPEHINKRLEALESYIDGLRNYREKQLTVIMSVLGDTREEDNKEATEPQDAPESTLEDTAASGLKTVDEIDFCRRSSNPTEIRNEIMNSLKSIQKQNEKCKKLVRKGSILRSNVEPSYNLAEEEEKEVKMLQSDKARYPAKRKLDNIIEIPEVSSPKINTVERSEVKLTERDVTQLRATDSLRTKPQNVSSSKPTSLANVQEKEAWEEKVIHQWTHDDLLDFLKRNHRALLKVFQPTKLTGKDIVSFKLPDFIKLGILDGVVRNRIFQDIQSRKAKAPIPTSSEEHVADRPIEEYQCSDVLVWLGNIGLSEYASIFRRNVVNGKRLMNLKQHNLTKWGIRKRDDRKLILSSRSELFKVKKDRISKYVASSISKKGTELGVSSFGSTSSALDTNRDFFGSKSTLDLSSERTTPYNSSSRLTLENPKPGLAMMTTAAQVADDCYLNESKMIYGKGEIVLTKVLGSSEEQWVQAIVEEVNHKKGTYDLSVRNTGNSRGRNQKLKAMSVEVPPNLIRKISGNDTLPSIRNLPLVIKSSPSSIFSPAVKPKADLPEDPRDWSAEQVIEAISKRVGSRTAAVFRLERLDGRALLEASPQKQANLVSNMSTGESRKIKTFLMELKQKADSVDALTVGESKDNEDPSLRLSLPLPQFWGPQHVSEWIEGIDGGAYSKYGSKITRLRITGEQLLSSQKNSLSRIGIRDQRELKSVQNHIQNFPTIFQPVEIHPSKWTSEHIEEFIITQGDESISKYAPQFVEAGLGAEALVTLTGERLRKLGVFNSAHQRKLLSLVSSLWVSVGDVVTFAGFSVHVRYIGFPRLPAFRGEWIGIELKPSDVRRLRRSDKAKVNNGCVRGIRFFSARRGCGLFVRRSEIAAKRQRSS